MPRQLPLYFSLLALLFGSKLHCAGKEQGSYLDIQQRIVEIYKQHNSSVVRVKSIHQSVSGKGAPQVEQRFGTGFFISPEGHVFTNVNVAYKADRIWVVYDEVSYVAETIGHDLETNLSLLKLDNTPPNLTFLNLTDAGAFPPVGSMVVRISSPLMFDPSPELGIVTGHESQYFTSHVFPCTYIRTSIPGGPGEGGAPLIDLRGRLIGLMVASIPELSETYALPARAALRIRDDLLFTGKVSYAWVGFEISVRTSLTAGKQIIIREIIDGTPAMKAGLKTNDVILSIGEYKIKSVNDVRNAIFYTRAGQFIDLAIQRDGETMTINLQATERPANEPREIPVSNSTANTPQTDPAPKPAQDITKATENNPEKNTPITSNNTSKEPSIRVKDGETPIATNPSS